MDQIYYLQALSKFETYRLQSHCVQVSCVLELGNLSAALYTCIVLVQARKTGNRPNMTGKLLTGNSGK